MMPHTETRPQILITGASKGIGRAIAERFLAGGWHVVGTASNPTTAQALRQALPQLAEVYATDLAVPDAARTLGHQYLAQFGTPHVLVNNAGRFLPGGILTEPDENFELQMNLNLNSVYYLTKAVAPAMVQAGRGSILNICSTASQKAYPNGGSYGISKHALLGLTKNLREELKLTGVRVVAILPGPTLTDSWAGTELPPQRFMASEDIAEVAWLAANLPPQTVVEDIVLRPQLGDI
jgi:NAD(P)-dependent dehydrogenase (short-subunit alcohol dehydrogenase family)